MDKDDKKLATLAAAVALSMLAHVLALHLLIPSLAKATPDLKYIELVNLPKNEIPEVKEPEKKPETEPHGQIVDLGPKDPNDMTPPPEHARYLSERNMRVKEETVNPSRSRTGSPGARPEPQKSERPPQNAQDRTREKSAAKESKTSAPIKRGRAPSITIGRPMEVAKNDRQALSKDDLKITMSDLNRSMNADNGSIDYIPTARLGDVTCVDSRQYTYASFFNRFKKVLAFFWRSELDLRAMSYNIPDGVYYTVIDIAYNGDGSYDSASVVTSCGIPVLDAATIGAARKTAPIYGIPPQLQDSDNKFRTRFGFILTVQRQNEPRAFPR
jgi:outer membrane biosynthesis protein TonB